MGYFRDMYGTRGQEFIEGVVAGMTAVAVWNHGTQWVGSPEKRLRVAVAEAVRDLRGPNAITCATCGEVMSADCKNCRRLWGI